MRRVWIQSTATAVVYVMGNFTKMDCCRVAPCTFLRHMIINIAKISIYSTEQVNGYFFHKNVEDIVVIDNPLMTVTLAGTK